MGNQLNTTKLFAEEYKNTVQQKKLKDDNLVTNFTQLKGAIHNKECVFFP